MRFSAIDGPMLLQSKTFSSHSVTTSHHYCYSGLPHGITNNHVWYLIDRWLSALLLT